MLIAFDKKWLLHRIPCLELNCMCSGINFSNIIMFSDSLFTCTLVANTASSYHAKRFLNVETLGYIRQSHSCISASLVPLLSAIAALFTREWPLLMSKSQPSQYKKEEAIGTLSSCDRSYTTERFHKAIILEEKSSCLVSISLMCMIQE